VVLGLFLCPSWKGGGRQLDGVGVSSVGGGQGQGGQGLGLTHDVTGHASAKKTHASDARSLPPDASNFLAASRASRASFVQFQRPYASRPS